MRYVFCIIIGLFLSFQFSIVYATLTEGEMISIAEKEFQKTIPAEYQNEYRFITIRATTPELEYSTTYYVIWSRYINDIPVFKDGLTVIVDSSTGNVTNVIYSFSYPASEIDTSYQITKVQSLQIALDAYTGGEVKTDEKDNPYLVVKDKDLLWMINLRFPSKKGEPGSSLWLGLDAKTGETKYFNPSMGSNIQQVPTSFDPTAYFIGTYGIYALIVVIVVAGGFLYYKKGLFAGKK